MTRHTHLSNTSANTPGVHAAVDLAIVGAGPCGLAVAVAAKEQGIRFAILDRGAITESLTHYPHYMTFFSTAERLEIGDVPFTIPEPKPTRREALAYYRHVVAHHELQVRQYEDVTRVVRHYGPEVADKQALEGEKGENHDGFVLHTRTRDGREDRVHVRAVVIPTGGFGEPNRLDLPAGEPDGRVIHYYKEPFPFFDQDVAVVGGGNSAVEAALELYRSGVRVRMVHFAAVFDRGVKPWVRPDIDNRIEHREIVMHWKSRIAALGPRTATIVCDDTGGATEVPNDWVLAMTGWRPDHTLLDGLGVRTDPRTGIPDHDRATMETNVPGVFIAGVIAAGYNANRIFIENGREHGALIAAAVAGEAS
ncbi:MAG: YpdA family putative bacillithiol disulfide reductase [Gemmatimonadetes bacterium]|nr:YpdA family putative bacillithiol disulfide reductase [Gemmatimonadota bacterium]MYH54201.1 YpdA family putative bacillithiol disulfide reductase [Gemmatimonadota bacterium]MYK67556.1 YpdA family putative bacillithiol disulfide reductase [Gemmatimonadota bacterium]